MTAGVSRGAASPGAPGDAGARGITSSHLFWQLASFALFFGLWEIAGRWPVSAAFPPFSATFLAMLKMIGDGSLGKAYLSTLQPLVIGIAICGIAGVGFGIGMGLSRTVEWLSLPIFIILQAAPMAAIIPLITYIYGIGLTSKVLAVIFLAAPVIVMNSYKGIRNTNPSLIQMCRSFQGTWRQEVTKIILPYAAALIFTGPAAGAGDGIHRRGDRRTADHADRHRRSHHLPQLRGRLPGDVRGDLLHHPDRGGFPARAGTGGAPAVSC